MPKRTLYTLTWSFETNTYGLALHGQSFQHFSLEDEPSWLAWLATHTSFLFQGRAGSLRAYNESRPRGGDYWYAYSFTHQRLRKCYLGRNSALSFAHLEEVAAILTSENSSPARPTKPHTALSAGKSALPPLLHSSRQMPYLPRALVERPRLLKHLDAILTHPLTLLSATAGWGKTTLLSAWASRSPVPTAWLSLDALDNDPTRFWLSVLSALRTCLPELGQTALLMLRSPQPPPLTTIVATLLNELSHQDTPTFLLLDDYHLIGEQAIHDSMLFLLEHLSPHLHLVLSSRVDPPFSLSRFRARGHLLELRDTDLRFEEEETARFLTHTMSLSLSQTEIAELTRRTGGWITGLQLAALSLVHHPDRAAFVLGFSGSHRYVLDYVQEDILARFSLAMQHFVLHISILHRMSASLCQAVTLEPQSQRMLDMMERANLFLVPLDDERRWYRFHDLFREALLARLHATQPEMVPLLHQRAAHWYEEQGEFREAISSWFSAADFSSAARLMEQTARLFWLRGEATTMHRWVMELPDVVVYEHAHLVLTTALYLLNANYYNGGTQLIKTYKAAEQLMGRVEIALREPEAGVRPRSSTEMRLLQQHLHLLRVWSGATASLVRGDYEQYRLIYQQMQDLEEDEDVIWQMIPLFVTFIFYYVFQREGALLVPRLQDAWQRVSGSGDSVATVEVRRWLTLAYLCAGRLHQAYQECLAALHLLEQAEGSAILTGFSMGLALVLYQWNRLEEARSTLQGVIRDATAWQHVNLLGWSYRTLVQVELAAGDLAAAHQAMQEAEQAAHQGDVRQQSWFAAVQVQWWLAVGKLAEASDWAARVVFRQDAWEPHRVDEFLALIHVYLAQQQYVQAVQTLERFSAHLDRPGDISTTISFLLLSVVALHQTGMCVQAHTVLARLLALTEAEGHMRVYLDAGEPMREVLQSFLEAPPDNAQPSAVSRSYIIALLAVFQQEEDRRLRRAKIRPIKTQERLALPSSHTPHVSPDADPESPGVPVLIEPLSHQELRVLHRLCAGRTNQEIASDLVVSINTVKGHVKKIYSKLQVRKRIEACAVARALRLLVEKTFRPADLAEPPSSTT